MVQADLVRDDNGMEDMSAFFSPTSNVGTLPHIADDDDGSMGGDLGEEHEEPEHDLEADDYAPSDDDPRAQNVLANDDSATMEMEESQFFGSYSHNYALE